MSMLVTSKNHLLSTCSHLYIHIVCTLHPTSIYYVARYSLGCPFALIHPLNIRGHCEREVKWIPEGRSQASPNQRKGMARGQALSIPPPLGNMKLKSTKWMFLTQQLKKHFSVILSYELCLCFQSNWMFDWIQFLKRQKIFILYV